jgi:hypothetical protein
MKTRKRWTMLLTAVVAVAVMLSVMPVAHAATYDTCNSGTGVLPGASNIVAACRNAGVNPASFASLMRACQTARCPVSAPSLAACVKACQTTGGVNASNLTACLKASQSAGCAANASDLTAAIKACQSSGRTVNAANLAACLKAGK